MKKSARRIQRSIKPIGRNPVIAVRVPAPLHRQIKDAAKRSDRSMSEEMAYLLGRAFEWQAAFLERGQIIEEARRILADTNERCRQIEAKHLENVLRRKNWRRDERGCWTPPEVHGLPANGFIPTPPDQEDQS